MAANGPHGWNCGRCGQLNTRWAAECGRCEQPKEVAPRKRGKRARPPVPRPPRPATDRQSAFLGAVGELTVRLGRAPSATEVAAHLGISRIGARKQLQNLASKGLLVDVPKVVSSGQWALTELGAALR